MPALFNRRCQLILAPPVPGSLRRPNLSLGISITNLRVQFKVEKTIMKQPNTSEMQVFNLASSTRSRLQGKGTLVVLLAGYANGLAQVFSGDSRTIDHIRDGADWTTKIQCGDGERSYQFAIVRDSFRPGVTFQDVANRIIGQMGVDPGNSAAQFATIQKQFVGGYSMHGKASAELDSVLAGTGLEWSVQDGVMQILKPTDTTAESVVLINQQSGMIGSPQHGTPEVLGGPGILKVKMLLQPLVKPGRKVKVEAQSINGFFRVEKVIHEGDTFGGNWYTHVEARAL